MPRQRRFFIAAGRMPVLQASSITLQATVRCQALDGWSAPPIHLRPTGWSLRCASSVDASRRIVLSRGRPAPFTRRHAG